MNSTVYQWCTNVWYHGPDEWSKASLHGQIEECMTGLGLRAQHHPIHPWAEIGFPGPGTTHSHWDRAPGPGTPPLCPCVPSLGSNTTPSCPQATGLVCRAWCYPLLLPHTRIGSWGLGTTPSQAPPHQDWAMGTSANPTQPCALWSGTWSSMQNPGFPMSPEIW